MRVFYLPLNYGDVVQSGVYDAFRDAGVELGIFDYFAEYEANKKDLIKTRAKFIQSAIDFNPDLLHVQIQHTEIIDSESIKKVRRHLPQMKVSNWTGDVRNFVPKTYKDIASASDYNLISSTGQIDLFKKEIGKEVLFWQIGYNPKLYYQGAKREKYDFDCTFIANHNSIDNYPGRGERENAVLLLRKKFGNRFGLFGNGWDSQFGSLGGVEQKRVAEIYHNSFCSISISHYNDLNHYFSDRLLMCLASGRPTISYRFPHWESYFTDKCDLIIANTIEEIPEKADFLLRNPLFANFIGESGAEKAAAEHTYLSRIYELLDIVKR